MQLFANHFAHHFRRFNSAVLHPSRATPHGCPATHTNKARQAVMNSSIDVGPDFDVEVQTNRPTPTVLDREHSSTLHVIVTIIVKQSFADTSKTNRRKVVLIISESRSAPLLGILAVFRCPYSYSAVQCTAPQGTAPWRRSYSQTNVTSSRQRHLSSTGSFRPATPQSRHLGPPQRIAGRRCHSATTA